MKMKYMRRGMSISWDEEEEIKTLLIGHRVRVEGNNLILDNGKCLEVKPNEGCGGCSAGWYGIDYLNECDNAITDVKFVREDLDEYDEQHCYKIFVFADNKMINLLSVSGDDGNGYYGTGYSFWVSIPWLGDN